MSDPLSQEQRSAHMGKIKGRGNRSTEGRVEAALTERKVTGWRKHPKGILGSPDFYFEEERLAVFVDGCFWHGCPKCARRVPQSRWEFWSEKIESNRRRDQRQRRTLRREGYHVMRIWEHDLKADTWLRRLQALLQRISASRSGSPGPEEDG